MLTLAILLAAAMLPLSVWLLVRNPFNIAAISAVLTWAFGVLPGIYYQQTGMIPSYSWRNFVYLGGPLSNDHESLQTLLLLCWIGTAFTLGAFVGWLTRPIGRAATALPCPTSPAATFVMSALWGISAIYFLSLSGWDFKAFVLPVRETFRASGYLETIFIMMPVAIVAKSYWQRGRLDRWSILWIAIAVMAAFSRNQRRDFITMAFFLVGLLVIVGNLIRRRKAEAPQAEIRPKLTTRVWGLGMLAAGAALVPLLWYSRVYFSSTSQGKPFDLAQARGFTEILLGSPATGYPTLGLVRDYIQHAGAQLFHMPAYLAGGIVPRAVWPAKPMDVDTTLMQHYRLVENPSAFWYGELYYSFGVIAVAVALGLGFLAFRIAHDAIVSRSVLVRTLGVVVFMHSVTFYKNGFSHFIVNSSMMCAFLLFAWYFPSFRRQSSQRSGRSPRRDANQEYPPGSFTAARTH